MRFIGVAGSGVETRGLKVLLPSPKELFG